MKIKEDFVFQAIAGEYIIVPVSKEADRLNGIIKLNESSAYLWKLLSLNNYTQQELVDELIKEYSINEQQAQEDVNSFIREIQKLGCIE